MYIFRNQEKSNIKPIILELDSIKTSYQQKNNIILYNQSQNKLKDKVREIVKFFNFKDYNSLSNFIKFHRNKFPHLINIDSYIKFAVDIFFDPSKVIYNQISKINTFNSRSLVSKLQNQIINDQRFNKWFRDLNEIDNESLRFRIGKLQIENNHFEYDSLYNLVYHSNSDLNSVSPSISNRYEISEISTTTKLSDFIINKIIGYSLEYIDDMDDLYTNSHSKFIQYQQTCCLNIPINTQFLRFSMVSKQFHRVISKLLSNIYFEWVESPISLNNNKFNLIKDPPLYFDYDSIKFIPFNRGTDYANHILSRVETFTLDTDEFDYSTSGAIHRDLGDVFNGLVVNKIQYRKSILSENYLLYPPPMPNLKNILVYGYHGYTSNYSRLLGHILMTTPNTGDHGVHLFSVRISRDFNHNPSFNLDPTRMLDIFSEFIEEIKIYNINIDVFTNDKTLLEILEETLVVQKEYNDIYKYLKNK
ncbi:hypothetical protein PPL_07372 [Heterostelium album PN500]|uniref:F-box domain-containing protein n=1 Tax=Heterostelium pallidum (strain ATCC 26659 / Pp 5 / PN500) TaxID=670386 RepID=D3BFS1_HETP5|nr:hypothetical protein PPL_07372 [Heterostelium album PN500]EFA79681.1 hypothetical protein PPL_07372 [Heterostelium album PN500]|eukprot:XP_020431802.1 hypothetical protein PPL_07372 [Heterostelium album PN500]